MCICTNIVPGYTATMCIYVHMCIQYVHDVHIRTCVHNVAYVLFVYDSVAGCSFTMVDVEGRTALHWTADHTTDDALLAVLRAYPPLLNRRCVCTCTIPHIDC